MAVKSLETGVVPPVPNFRDPDPELGMLNLSQGGCLPGPVRAAPRGRLRIADLDAAAALDARRRWPAPRSTDELGYDYRVADRAAWKRVADGESAGSDARSSRSSQHRLRVVDQGALTAAVAAAAAPEPVTVAPAPSYRSRSRSSRP